MYLTLSIAERALTLDAYRTERFEPFCEPCFLDVLDEAYVATHAIGHVLVLDVAGKLEGSEAMALCGRIRELVEQGERTIVVNLKALTSIDSRGLGELVRSYTTVKRARGAMPLVNPPRYFREFVRAVKFI